MSFARSFLLSLVCISAGCSGGERPLSVLLVSIDTTRADRLGCYGRPQAGTPHLDALAARGLRCERAYAPVPLTLPSHTSLLTGAGPRTHGVRDNGRFRVDAELTTLAELARARGRRTAAFVAAYPLSAHFGLDQGFELYDDALRGGEGAMAQRDGAEVVERASAWLDALDADEPFLLWAHLFDPHWPYDPPEPFRSAHPGDPYQGEIAYADAQLGRLLAALDAAGRSRETLVVVCSDHGEGLGEHGEDTHGFLVHDATMRVPLLFAGPGVPEGAVLNELAALEDVLPTVVELADWSLPPQVRGRSLGPAWRGESTEERSVYLESRYPRIHYGYSELEGLVRGAHKLVCAPASDEAPQLYDVLADPGEERDLALASDALGAELERGLDAVRARLDEAPRWSAAAELDAEGQRALAQLGYAGESAGAPSEGVLLHPRHGVRVQDLLQQVTGLLNVGRSEEAAPLVGELEALEPGGVAALYARGHLLTKQAVLRPSLAPEAVELLRSALVLAPERAPLWRVLAQACERAGDWAGAASAWSVCCGLAPEREDFERQRRRVHEQARSRLQALESAGRADADEALALRAALPEESTP